MNAFIRPPALPKGLKFEEDFFGISSVNLYHQGLPRILNLTRKAINIYCNDKFQQRVYNLNPAEPETPMAQEIFYRLKDLLPDKLKDKLRMFCTLGTSADLEGVDFVIRLRGQKRQVFVDLTANASKKDKDNILILQKFVFDNIFERNDQKCMDIFINKLYLKLVGNR